MENHDTILGYQLKQTKTVESYRHAKMTRAPPAKRLAEFRLSLPVGDCGGISEPDDQGNQAQTDERMGVPTLPHGGSLAAPRGIWKLRILGSATGISNMLQGRRGKSGS